MVEIGILVGVAITLCGLRIWAWVDDVNERLKNLEEKLDKE